MCIRDSTYTDASTTVIDNQTANPNIWARFNIQQYLEEGKTIDKIKIEDVSTSGAPVLIDAVHLYARGKFRFTPTGSLEVTENEKGTPEHFDGTVGTDPVTITPSAETRSILIKNTHDDNVLYVSFNGGSKWFSIDPHDHLEADVKVSSFQVKGSASGTTYEGIASLVS